MRELVSILMIGVSLSMDTFSLSLSLGSLSQARVLKIIPLVVGLFHFFMPIFGNVVGLKLLSIFRLTSHFLLGFILIALAINLAIHYFKDEEINVNLSFWGILFFAFSVSFDSFTVGMGINAITERYLIASFIFALCSGAFTFLGILIGKYSSRLIGKSANMIGIIILFLLGLCHLL
ncbi:MAG: manganese efflux pump MntP family protein [Bacilli bacterium]|nr:manganese efflux pump MntP family protein [Bacilli bacterium]